MSTSNFGPWHSFVKGVDVAWRGSHLGDSKDLVARREGRTLSGGEAEGG